MEQEKSLTTIGGDTIFPLQYSLRKTGEDVEIIAFNETEIGARSAGDWVSYIGADGTEHIKEPLTLSFDFKSRGKMAGLLDKILEGPKYEPLLLPDIWETRVYEFAKQFVIERGFSVAESLDRAAEFKEAFLEKFPPKKGL